MVASSNLAVVTIFLGGNGVQWLVENGENFNALDTNTKQMTDALESLGREYSIVKVVPFSHEMIIPDGVDLTLPTLAYGSTLTAALAPERMQPGAFYRSEFFDPRNWKHPEMLNTEVKVTTAGKLRSDWIQEPVFIKSVKDKLHAGMVIEPEDKDWWIVEQSEPNADDEMLLSPVQKISQEWRFFLVDGKVITGSQYRHDGVRRLKEPVADRVRDTAQRYADMWLPTPTVVMDLCLVEDRMKVVEFNCLNSSGFYNSDVCAIIEVLDNFDPLAQRMRARVS